MRSFEREQQEQHLLRQLQSEREKYEQAKTKLTKLRGHVSEIKHLVGASERPKFPWQDWNRVYPFEKTELERYHSGELPYLYNMSKDVRHLANKKNGLITDLSMNRKLDYVAKSAIGRTTEEFLEKNLVEAQRRRIKQST